MRDPRSAESRLTMLQRLAYLGTECTSVSSGDYGADLFGGSTILHEVKPWQRVPMWRRGSEGPPCNFDMALHLDFVDWDAYRAYARDPTHAEASRANELANLDELTARVDWYYEGEVPPTHPGGVKHVAMFVWDEHASEVQRQAALDAAESLGDAAEVKAVMVGHNVGKLTTDYDWILDLHLHDRAAAERVLAGGEYAAAMEAVADASRYEWTASMSHVMHRP